MHHPFTKETLLSSLQAFEREENVPAIVEALLRASVEWEASDIHLEPTVHSFWVRFRMDGVLQEIVHLKKSLAPNLIARTKVLSDLLTYRTDIPQEGSLRKEKVPFLQDRTLDFRISVIPILLGEKAVIRILSLSSAHFALDSLGFPPEVQETLQSLSHSTEGVLLFTGPAGSGKTTSIYATLSALVPSVGASMGPSERMIYRNIVTLEDPVECIVPGITQIQVNHASGFGFIPALRSVLRQDPEIIMLGEIRDTESARIAIQAGLTGHFVISTLHTGHAALVFTRLLEMGIDPYLLRTALRTIIAQRLVRVLCPSCKRVSRETLPEGFLQGKVFEAVGCPECRQTGYHGRTAMVECLEMNADVRNLISVPLDERALAEAARQNGMLPLSRRAMECVNAGSTSLFEIRRVLM